MYQHCRNKIGINGVVVSAFRKKIKNVSSGSHVLYKTSNLANSHRRTGTFGDFLAQKKCAMPESVRFEIGMQLQTFTIFASNETAIIGKTVQLRACILNSITVSV